MAMAALKFGTLENYMQLIKKNADIVNLSQINVDENTALPAV